MLELSQFVWTLRYSVQVVFNNFFLLNGTDRSSDQNRLFFAVYIFIIYICLKQNYIKQYKSLQINTLFSGYRILKLTGFAKKGAIQDF